VRGQGSQNVPPYSKPIEKFESHGENALNSILRLGIENKMPLGIIRVGDGLCTKVDLAARGEPATAVIDTLIKQIGGYRWRIKDDLLVIEPQSIPLPPARLLATEIPLFSVGSITTQELEAVLLMFTKAVLRPGEGSVGSIIGSPDDPRTPAFQMRNATIEDILNHIVKQGEGGAWILLPIPDDYKKSADSPFVKIVNYSDKHVGAHISCGDLASKTLP
jgi:hypothetical protein